MSNPASSQNQQKPLSLPHHVVIFPEFEHQEWLKTSKQRTKVVPRLLNTTSGKKTCSIFRAPQILKIFHPQPFQPHIVSIGPYYYKQRKKSLRMIEEHKWRLLGVVLARAEGSNVDLDEFYKAIAVKEKQIRESYSENIDEYKSQQLIQMMVLDGCFILEFIFVIEHLIPNQPNDPIFMPRWILHSLSRDLLKLENQIPFFVIQTLFDLHWHSLRKGKHINTSLTEIILNFFHHTIQIKDKVPDRCKNLVGEHLLDLFRKSFIPSSQEQDGSKMKKVHHSIRPVEKLRASGIKFKQRENAESFLDIKFNPGGVLEIPTLSIGSFSSSFLLNCVAFEQCYRFCENHFTSYVVFMSCLINSPSDAGHLLDGKIFEKSGTDEELVKFFNDLKRDISVDIERSYLAKVIQDVNEYYNNRWHVRWAEFKSKYFDSTWTFLSALAAFILLVLTIIQCFFAVYAYVRPPT